MVSPDTSNGIVCSAWSVVHLCLYIKGHKLVNFDLQAAAAKLISQTPCYFFPMADYKFAFHLILVIVMFVILPYCEADWDGSRARHGPFRQLDSMVQSATEAEELQVNGTSWAVLVAGSNGYQNYRHQVRHIRYLK